MQVNQSVARFRLKAFPFFHSLVHPIPVCMCVYAVFNAYLNVVINIKCLATSYYDYFPNDTMSILLQSIFRHFTFRANEFHLVSCDVKCFDSNFEA